MIDERLLRQRLEVAVADVRPPSRLHEIVGEQPGRSPRRGQQLLAVAAVVLVLAAIAVLVASNVDPDDAVTTDQPSTTTTIDRRPTVGEAVQVPVEVLPAGFELIDEVAAEAEIADDAWPYSVLTFAASPESLEAGGPAVRIAVLPLQLWVSDLRAHVESFTGERPELGDIVTVDPPWTPSGADELLAPADGWVRLARTAAPDVLLLVDGRSIDQPTLEAMVAQATPST